MFRFMPTIHLSRREFIAGAGLSLLATRIALAEAPVRPNILWLVSEDNGPFLGCYGDRFAETPRLDRLSSEGVRFTHAFANVPVCAPARCTLATGMYASSLGTQHMRSQNPLPRGVSFFSNLLRASGYYCANNAKEDYNVSQKPDGAWDESSRKAHWQHREAGQPFFSVFNFGTSHESSLHGTDSALKHDPAGVTLPPYHPDTPEFRHDWAQYYDRITAMDGEVGARLDELEAAGLAEDTIVFYFSDHGGVLPRSKRYLYDSGIRVPLIVRVPSKFQHLIGQAPGTADSRLVSFVDFAPTVLKLAGVTPPPHFQGNAFLGEAVAPGGNHVYTFRDRMDERYDLSRGIREDRFHYIRNFMPQLAWEQHVRYMHRMPAMQSWQAAHDAMELNAVQRRPFETKPMEELYDTERDPHEVENLAGDPAHAETLVRLRGVLVSEMIAIGDTGLIPEGMMLAFAQGGAVKDALAARGYDVAQYLRAAWTANDVQDDAVAEIAALLERADPVLRYWGAAGCVARGGPAALCAPLTAALDDDFGDVRVLAAQALVLGGCQAERALEVLGALLLEGAPAEALRAANALDQLGPAARPWLRAKRDDLRARWKDGDYPWWVLEKVYSEADPK